jgi:methyl-accepting chemotaxis protein
MKIGHWIIAAVGSVLILLLILVCVVLAAINGLSERQKVLYERDMQSMQDFIRLRNNINLMQNDVLLMLLIDNPAARETRKSEIDKATTEIYGIFPGLEKRFEHDPKTTSQINALEKAMHDYVNERDNELVPLLLQRDIEDAKTLIFGIEAENLQKIDNISATFVENSVAGALKQVKESSDAADLARTTVYIICLAALGLSFAACWLLRQVLQEATGELHEAVGVLGHDVERILSSVSESAAGTNETAAAVNETTATVEQLKQTSQLSSEKAKGVFQTAQRSEEISSAGRKATQETVEGMKRIRKEMDQIAQSMSRLNEKARDIVDIIATVDDLAKQSNLLAVNAAIEAAKAGEHGKGFAVVAQEVKNMAAQSKQATAQVRAILDEIQGAAAQAAQATELGSQAVDAAVKQSTQASDSITQLASSVSESATAAAQIASASEQQVHGADQVVTAMIGIKEAANHNISTITRVEEAGNSLTSLGRRLQELVRRY